MLAVRAIELLAHETELLATISLTLPERMDYQAVLANGDRACALMRALLARDAIPPVRWAFFTQAEHNIGLSCSILEVFARNGSTGEDTFRHVHFLRHLRYFIYGPDLPQSAIDAFTEAVEECGPITSGDIAGLTKLAKRLAQSRDEAEEFYKLALEMGLGYYSRNIRDAVARLPRRP